MHEIEINTGRQPQSLAVEIFQIFPLGKAKIRWQLLPYLLPPILEYFPSRSRTRCTELAHGEAKAHGVQCDRHV